MIIEFKLVFKPSKYSSNDYAKAEVELDSDEVDDESLRVIIAGIVNSAIRRRDVKLSEAPKLAPPDVLVNETKP